MESILSSNPLVQYKLLRQVGKGSYGKVYRALERSTNATLAAQPVNRVPASGDGSSWLLQKARSAPTTTQEPSDFSSEPVPPSEAVPLSPARRRSR